MFFGGLPGMGGPGGFPGIGGTGGVRGRGKPADTTKLYTLLEVEKNAGCAEIRKAYRKLAVRHHPDKGGDPGKFIEITRAYEVLGDSDKRAKYDRFGEEGSEVGGTSDGRKRQKTKDVVQPLGVTLEHIYMGATGYYEITRTVSRGTECSNCRGQGMKVECVRIGPIIQQMKFPCWLCSGVGRSLSVSREREVLEVVIQKGAMDGHKILFREKADEHPDADTGDVIFVCTVQEHPIFKRKGDDLFAEKTIPLIEAIRGFSLSITHLDGRKLPFNFSAGDVVKAMADAAGNVDLDAKNSFGMMRSVKGEGMPTYMNPSLFGNFFLTLTVEVPESLSSSTQQIIRSLRPSPLNKRTLNRDNKDADIHVAEPPSKRHAACARETPSKSAPTKDKGKITPPKVANATGGHKNMKTKDRAKGMENAHGNRRPGPSFSVERSRSQVMCRTGLGGPGSTVGLQYGKGKKYKKEVDAVAAAKIWLKKELKSQGL